MNYYFLIIISKTRPSINQSIDYFWINKDFLFFDENHIKVDNELYEFTYLIYTNEINCNDNNINLLKEDLIPVTNFFHETNIENIYFVKENYCNVINDIINEN